MVGGLYPVRERQNTGGGRGASAGAPGNRGDEQTLAAGAGGASPIQVRGRSGTRGNLACGLGEVGGAEAPLRVSGTRKRLALVLLCAASFVAVLDTTIVSVALPSMRRDLGFTTGDAQWILNGYALAFGGLLLLGGRAGDLHGRRRLFVAGLA